MASVNRMSLKRVFVIGAVVWTSIGIVNGMMLYQALSAEAMEHSWPRLVTWQALAWGIWAFLTPAVWIVTERWPLGSDPRWRSAAANVAAGLVIVLAHICFLTVLTRLYPPMEWARHESVFDGLIANLRNRSILDGVVFASILAVANWSRELRRARERSLNAARLEAELARAELRALQVQLHPHFLFNALHSIAGMIREEKNREAVDAVASLSDLLRYLLDHAHDQEVTLEEELDFVERYLEVQKARFGDRLRIELEISPDVRDAVVPSLVLQPLVENAISHGIAKRPEGGMIRIRVLENEQSLRISVTNEGPRYEPPSGEGDHIGLENTRARLEMIHGDDARLAIGNGPGGVIAEISMPLRRSTS
jgi:signal transduction histidine kinase